MGIGRTPGALFALLVAAGQGPTAEAQLTASGETLLKAQYIERFTRFIEWPAEQLDDRHPLFIVCIAGSGEVADALPQVSGFERWKNKPLAFRWVRAGDDLSTCHLVFLSPTEEGNLAALVDSVRNRPVLTVADVPGAAGRGTIISFYREGDRVLFEINRAAVERSGLRFSSRLLRLARLVGPEKGP